MEQIVFLDRDSIRATLRQPGFPHEWTDYPSTSPDQIVPRLRDASIAIVNKVALGQRELEQLPKLRLIAVAATGYNLIDLDACRHRGIAVTNVTGYAVHAVPEHALMLMLALRRNLLGYVGEVASGEWERARQFCLFDRPIRELHASTLGIVGYGTLGRAMADVGSALGMRVIVAEHRDADVVRAGRTAFPVLLRQSDVISLHCPLTEETRGLIGGPELAAMKPSAILINTARGGLVDETALAAALRAGEIAGAGFDVLTGEPPINGNPLLDPGIPNLIVTPHNAWASDEAMQSLADQLMEVIDAFAGGEPRNLVT
jgi:glycerate dehydrogenase